MSDELSKLLETQWRGIAFPTKNVELEMTQSLAQHAYPDRDGARVEATGRNPKVISGTAIFVNTITPVSGDSWSKGSLFPSVFSKFMEAMDNRATGEFQHPVLGKMFCKAASAKYSLNGDFRGGALVDFQFIETISDDKAASLTTGNLSKMGQASALATNLDKSIAGIKNMPKLPKAPNFATSVRQLQAIFDKPALLAKKGMGQIETIKHNCNQVLDVLKKANSVVHGETISTATALKVNVAELKQQLLAKDRPKAVHITKSDTTLVQLSGLLKASTDDLIKLNPELVKNVVVAKGTLVRYYKD